MRDLLTLNELLARSMHENNVETFYQLARMVFIKDEKYFDKFDLAFSSFISGQKELSNGFDKDIPNEWLKKQFEKYLSEEEKEQIKALGGLEELLKTFQERLKEQASRHQGGNKWIGTGGTSPFGAYGFNPFGIRIGQHESRHRRATKVWDKRSFNDLDEDEALDNRNMAIALRRLKQLSISEQTKFNLEQTIEKTANNAGFLTLCEERIKDNNAKVLMLFDIGGSMDEHVYHCQKLFLQAKKTFKTFAHYYFHNCPYESVWQRNMRRHNEKLETFELIKKYPRDTKLIFVGDATMSPYEIIAPYGSVEHMNEESGQVWLERIKEHFKHLVWLNPLSKDEWYAQSVGLIQQIVDNAMFPLSLKGLSEGMRHLMG